MSGTIDGGELDLTVPFRLLFLEALASEYTGESGLTARGIFTDSAGNSITVELLPIQATYTADLSGLVPGPISLVQTIDFDIHDSFTTVSSEFTFDGVVCFLTGTLIATPTGEAPVETLRPGHLVRTADGRTLPIRRVGRQDLITHLADPVRSLPVRIATGALGAELPRRDLLVSPDHALLLAGLLVQAGSLVGMPGITRATPATVTFTYWHVELAEHALLLAEGVAAESFLDPADGRRLCAVGEGEAALSPVRALPLPYPRVRASRQLPPWVRQRLTQHASVAA